MMIKVGKIFFNSRGTGCPTSYIRSSIGLNYDLRLSENLRSINHFEKLNKTNIRKFFWKIIVFFEYYGFILALKLGDNLI